jgi:hypothetical protein
MGSLDQRKDSEPEKQSKRFNLHNVFDFVADRYNLVQLLGEPTAWVDRDPLRKVVNGVMGPLLAQLAGNIYLDGSTIRAPLFGDSLTDVLQHEQWLQKTDPKMLNAVMRGLWGAEVKVGEMSDREYLGAMIVGRMIGPSIDVRSERTDWQPKEVQDLVDIWRTQLEPGMFMTKVQQGGRVMIVVNHEDGQRGGLFFHAQLDGDDVGGKLPSRIWSAQSSWRNKQQGRLNLSPAKMLYLETGELPGNDTPLELYIKPDSTGQEWQLLARGMRILIMQGVGPELLDKSSFALRENLPNHFSMQQYVDTMSHLMVAFFQDPEAVKTMLPMVGYPKGKMVGWPGKTEDIEPYLRANFGNDESGWGRLLNDCDVKMRGSEEVSRGQNYRGLGQLKMLAPLFEILSPLTYNEAMQLVKNTPRLSIEPCGKEIDWNEVRRTIMSIGLAGVYGDKSEAGPLLDVARKLVALDMEMDVSKMQLDNSRNTV